jgi:hypothetical protein
MMEKFTEELKALRAEVDLMRKIMNTLGDY